jgi:predicted RNA-binding protein Jag
MNELNEKIQTMVTLMGFSDFKMDADEDTRRVSLVIYDKVASKENIPALVLNLERLARLMAKQLELPPAIIDVNYYKKEREGLIIKLARAAARKAAATGEPVDLPHMNAYERLLVHTELAVRPDVETESSGEGRERHVVVRPI